MPIPSCDLPYSTTICASANHSTLVILEARDQRAEGPMQLLNAPQALNPRGARTINYGNFGNSGDFGNPFNPRSR
jgi:hypothetical protein